MNGYGLINKLAVYRPWRAHTFCMFVSVSVYAPSPCSAGTGHHLAYRKLMTADEYLVIPYIYIYIGPCFIPKRCVCLCVSVCVCVCL